MACLVGEGRASGRSCLNAHKRKKEGLRKPYELMWVEQLHMGDCLVFARLGIKHAWTSFVG